MRLNIVPPRAGLRWIKLGLQTFLKRPLAFLSLFVIFMVVLSLVSLVPSIGGALALVLLPAATLGLMAATREAAEGRYPRPRILLSALHADGPRKRAMLTLGLLYAAGFLLMLGASALFDGGKLARLALLGGEISHELVQAPDFQLALWVALALYLPLSLLFWHAPALVHWHDVPPLKSLFFSLVACLRNVGAYTVYGLGWAAILGLTLLAVTVVAASGGSAHMISLLFLPVTLGTGAMFFTSIYFTFRDSFVADPPAPRPGATTT